MEANLMIKEYPYNNQGLKELEEGESREESKIISRYPTVYIINDKRRNLLSLRWWTNNIAKRTAQHLHDDPKVRKIGGSYWNQNSQDVCGSATSTLISRHSILKNQLMLYLSSVENVKGAHIGVQMTDEYYPSANEVQDIFTQIWTQLHQKNSKLLQRWMLKDLADSSGLHLHKLMQ